MDLLTILKQFKAVKPDAEYARVSRMEILATPQRAATRFFPVSWGVRFLESGFTIALAGLLLLLIGGGFARWFGSSTQVGGIDTAALRAEAQAIDIQIKLTDLDYAAIAEAQAKGEETTLTSVVKKATRAIGIGTEPSDNKESGEPTIDEALKALSE